MVAYHRQSGNHFLSYLLVYAPFSAVRLEQEMSRVMAFLQKRLIVDE